ncbi:MAG: cytochrome c [Alphaproteobacteria bacterium]
MKARRTVRWLLGLAVAGVVALAAAFAVARWLTRDAVTVPDYQPSAERGALVLAAAGCTGCHTAEGADAKPLAGGRALDTPFGTFYGPNITPDPVHGIGAWSDEDFLRALGQGVAPDGSDLYPVFPYTSFTRMTAEDMLDLKAYLFSLEPVAQPNSPHEIGFPFSVRQTLTFWKLFFFAPGPDPAEAGRDEAWHRGRYLVRALGHCGECHTPRDATTGALDETMALAGTEDGPGGAAIPNITPDDATGIGRWSEGDIAFFLQSGMTADGDFVGGEMGEVIRGTGRLSPEDRAAMAAYLKSIAPVSHQIGRPRPAEDGGGDDNPWD